MINSNVTHPGKKNSTSALCLVLVTDYCIFIYFCSIYLFIYSILFLVFHLFLFILFLVIISTIKKYIYFLCLFLIFCFIFYV